MNVLFLATDAYGGRGGIAYYNRCLAEALAEVPAVTRITLLPRLVNETPAGIPEKVDFGRDAAGSKAGYLVALAWRFRQPCHLLICGHINLLPLAAVYSWFKRVPLVLQVHGIEVWNAPRSALVKACVRRVSHVWSVSGVTRDRMNAWAGLPVERYTVIPNTIRAERYGVAPKRPDLVERYGLQGKKVILTLARLDARERYKGIDEILEVLPELLQQQPELCYLIAGSGNDQPRLAAKAAQLGIADQVVFAGYVSEAEKADVLRIADAFAMPGRGEGFGIVYLEAMACGIPVVGSLLDASREALREGELGALADPGDKASLKRAILAALSRQRGVPLGLSYFAWPQYVQRVQAAFDQLTVGQVYVEHRI